MQTKKNVLHYYEGVRPAVRKKDLSRLSTELGRERFLHDSRRRRSRKPGRREEKKMKAFRLKITW